MSSAQLRPAPNTSPEPSVCVGRLFEEYSDRIYGFCLRRLRCPSDAEDSVQMTFLCAHRAVQRGVVPESESAWLFAIAKNVCRWQQRTTFRRNRLLTDADLDALASPPRDDHELLDGLKDALASIPESQQRALVLKEWHGLTSSQVAAQLGMSPPATYALLTRARHSLAHALTALPQQAALGVATLVYELRSHIKALFGGSAVAKTVAATTVVAAVAVGGVSAQRAVVGDRGASQAPRSAVVDADAAVEGQRIGVSTEPVRSSGSRSAADRRSWSSLAGSAAGEPGAVPGDAPAPESSPTAGVVPPQGLDETVGTTTSDLVPLPGLVPELPPLPGLLPELPPLPGPLPELPPLPVPPLPTDLLPPAPELPPVPSVPVPDSLPTVDSSAAPPLPDSGLPVTLP